MTPEYHSNTAKRRKTWRCLDGLDYPCSRIGPLDGATAVSYALHATHSIANLGLQHFFGLKGSRDVG